MILIANDDDKKMIERHEVEPFLEKYALVTGTELTLVGAGERPDFICEKRGRRYGLELVKTMRDPIKRRGEIILDGGGHLQGLDAAILIQEVTYAKDKKRVSLGWNYPKSTILVIQLIGSNSDDRNGLS